MNRGEKLRLIMEEKGFTVASLSKESGVAYTTIRSMIERDLKNASIDNVLKICKVLNISAETLSEHSSGSIQEETGVYEVITKNNKSVMLPMYGDVAAGMLTKIEGVTAEEVEHICLPRSILGKYFDNKDLFALTVNGESMNKVIPNKSIIVLKPIQLEDLKNEDIVVYSYDGDYSLKRFESDEEDKVFVFRPESTNRKFRETVIPFDTENELRIHGRVIAYAVTIN